MLIVLSIVLGLIFLQADDNFAGVQDRCVEHVSGWSKKNMCLLCTVSSRIGAMFFVVINMAFINIPAVDVFLKERPLFV